MGSSRISPKGPLVRYYACKVGGKVQQFVSRDDVFNTSMGTVKDVETKSIIGARTKDFVQEAEHVEGPDHEKPSSVQAHWGIKGAEKE